MTEMKILHYPHSILTQRAEEVEEINNEICSLFKTMRATIEAHNGIGLAAPQLSILQRLIVVSVNGRTFELANPAISWQNGQAPGWEGCLSLPGELWEVVRAQEIVVEGLQPNGKYISVLADDLLARAFQHEIDHLDGVLINARGRRRQLTKETDMEAIQE